MIIDALVLIALAAAWLGVVGFARLKTPLDRVHCVSFVNVAAGAMLCGAALCVDGVSDRALKIVMIFVVNIASGAVVSHLTGRAAMQREAAQ